MAEFSLPLTAEGAVTAPSGSLPVTVPTAESVTYLDVGPVNVLEIPEFGWAVADGVNPLRFVVRGSVYAAGGVAPSSAPTPAPAGAARATATVTNVSGTDFANNDRFTLYQDDISSSSIYADITFKTTLTASGAVTTHEVKRGTSVAATLTALGKLINGTGIDGVDYVDAGTRNVGTPFWPSRDIEASSVTATVCTLRAKTYGAGGNAYIASEEIDSGAVYSVATFSGGANATTGSAPEPGTYRYFFTWYRAADGAETGRSPIGSVTTEGNWNITVSGLTASADTTYDYVRIYRTTNTGVEFYLVGTVARGDVASNFTDDVSDEALARSLPWNELLHRDYTEGPPPRGRALAYWKGRLWTLGAHLHAEYSKGTVAVTVDSATVTFSVKGVTERMVGRTFRVASTSEEYRILSVSESGPTAVLDRVYEGATNASASFTIKDDYDACRLRASVEFLYNQWPEDESPGRVETDDVEGGTALLATKSRLFAFSKTSIIAVTGDGPESWEISKVAQGVGCVSPRLVVGAEGGGFFLSQDGFYAISPDESLTCISSPKSPRRVVAQGIDGTVSRVAWANVDQGYAEYDPTDRVVIFGVPLDGASVPNYEVIFDLQNGTWSLYKRSEFTAVAPITLPGGGQALLAGDRDGNLWHLNLGESDGFYGTEAVQTLSGAQTVRTLTVSGTPFSTTGDGEEGKPVIVLYAAGTVAFGKVASNTTSALTLAEDLATAPAASDQIVLGGIAWQFKSGYFTGGEEYRKKILRSVTIRHAPTTRGEYFLSFAVDGGSFALCAVGTSVGSLSDTDGKVKHMTQWPGDTHAINLRGFKPGGRATIRGGVLDWVIRENGAV